MASTTITAQGFDQDFYLQQKAAQMGVSVSACLAAITAAGLTPWQHYLQYGYLEGLSPNQYFNADQYAQSKAAQMGGGATAATFIAAWAQASGSTNVYLHYLQYGAFETGVEPSTGFDDDAYYTAKATQMGTTVAVAKAQIQAAGLTALSHYLLYGQYESLAFTCTPVNTSGQSYTLTTAVETITGTAGDDTFNAVVNLTTPAATTLNAGDSLVGAGGTDTLSVVASGTAANTTVSGFYSTDVEKLSIQNADATAGDLLTINATNMSGLNTVINRYSTADVTVTGLSSIVSLQEIGTQGNMTLTYNAAAVSSSSDIQNITLNGAHTTADGLINVNGIETIAITATGADSGSSAFATWIVGDASLKTVTLAGAQNDVVNLNLDAYADATHTATVNASSATGNVTATVTVTTNDKLSVVGGSGNDTFIINGMGNAVTAVGGSGTDTLSLTGSFNQTQLANVSGFEQFKLSTGSTVDLTNQASTLTTVTYAGGTGVGILTGVNSGVAIVEQGNGTSLGVTVTGAATGTSDVINLTLGKTGTSGTAGITAGTLTATNVETLNITSYGATGNTTGTNTLTVAGNTLTGVTVTGSENFTLTQSGSSIATYDASTATGVQNTAGIAFAATGATVTGGSGNDILTTGTEADSITAGDGNDSITAGAGNDTILGGTGNDTITGGLGADSMTAGAGADVFNYTAVTESNVTSKDTIADFVSGTDKILGTGATRFLGNFSDLATALANVTALGQAFFVTSTNTLYVNLGVAGTISAADYAITLTGVTSLAATDLGLGSQGTGNSVTLTALGAMVTTGTVSGATAKTTNLDDTITTQAAYLPVTTIDGGLGLDTLTVVDGGTVNVNNISAVEVLNLTSTTTANTVTNVGTDFATINLGNYGDSVTTSGSATSVTGGSGNDTITGAGGNDTIIGGDGNDVIDAKAGDNTVSGGAGNDTITASSASDSIDAGSGNDTVIGTGQTYTGYLQGGTGTDTLSLITADNIAGATVSGFEVLNVAGNASITMTVGQYNSFTSISGAGGAETVTFTGAGGSVTDTSGLIETYNGNALTSGLTFTSAMDVTYKIRGAATSSNSITLTNTTNRNESLVGGNANDTYSLVGSTLDGSDTITGGTGTNDVLNLTGNTAVAATLDSDFTGIEAINVANTTTNVAITFTDAGNVNANGMTITASSLTTGTLTFTALSTDTDAVTVIGGGADDSITGGAGNDRLVGGAGGDTLIGGAGNDTILAGDGNNQVTGGLGNDTITFGTGNNVLIYGIDTRNGASIYTDTVTGNTFQLGAGADVIQLDSTDIDASGTTLALSATNDAVGNVAAAAGTSTIGTVATNGHVDLSGTADSVIEITGTTATSYATAIGTGSVTVAHSNTFTVVYYDSSISSMVVSAITSGNTTLDSADTEARIATIAMSASEYTNLATSNVTFTH